MSGQSKRVKLLLSAGGGLISGLVSYFVQRAMRSAGFLDGIAGTTGEWLAVHISAGTAGWFLASSLFLLLYGVFLWILWHRTGQAAPSILAPVAGSASPSGSARPSDADGFDLVYRAHGKQVDICLRLPPTTPRERERLVDDLSDLLSLARAGYGQAQKSSLGYDSRVRAISSPEAMALGICDSLEEVSQTRAALAQSLEASGCRNLLEPLCSGLIGSFGELQQKLTAMQQLMDVLLREDTSIEAVKSIMLKYRDEVHFAFQYVFDHIQACLKALDRIRSSLRVTN